jgi:hypothetical protein
MAVRVYQLVFDAHKPRSLARFWSAVLNQKVLFETDDEVCAPHVSQVPRDIL